MPIEFPKDRRGRPGAIRVTEDGENFFVPVVMFGSDGVTPATLGGSATYVAAEYLSGTGNTTQTFTEDMHGVAFYNPHTAQMTFTINGITRPVPAGGTYEQKFKEPFTSITVTASGQWYCDVIQAQGTIATNPTPTPDTTAPDNVTNLVATPSETSVALSWTASASSDVSGYDVYRGSTLLTTVTGTTYTATGLTAATQYTFSVRTKDASGNVASGTSVTTTTTAASENPDTTAPDEVTSLTATPGETTVDLSWVASASGDVAGYNVYNGATKLNAGGIVTGTTYQVTGLTASTAYTFTVTAVDGSNNESTGSQVSTTTTAASGGGTKVEDASLLYFNDNVTPTSVSTPDADNYFQGSGNFTVSATVQPQINGSNAATGFFMRTTPNVISFEFTWNNLFKCTLTGKNSGGTAQYPTVTSPEYTDRTKSYHVSVVRAGSMLSLYVDNTLAHEISTVDPTFTFDTSGEPLYIARTEAATNPNSIFKNLAYYNRALTSEELTQNFNALK